MLNTADAELIQEDLSDRGISTMLLSREEGRAASTMSDVTQPPPGTVHQLWFDDGGTVRPAGYAEHISSPDAHSPAVLPDGPLTETIGMGVEPEDGSPQPASAPVTPMPCPGDGAAGDIRAAA